MSKRKYDVRAKKQGVVKYQGDYLADNIRRLRNLLPKGKTNG